MDTANKKNVEILRRLMTYFLMNQIRVKDYSVLTKLYEMARIDNKKILKKAHTIRNIFLPPSETIFSDMMYVLYEESESNVAILEYFCELVVPLFPQVVKNYNSLVEISESSPEKYKEYLCKVYMGNDTDILKRVFKLYMPLHKDDNRFIGNAEIYYSNMGEIIHYALFKTDKNIDDEAYVFNTEEEIFSSGLFERYLEKRREELAQYLSDLYSTKVTTGYLSTFIANTLKSRSDETRCSISNDIDSLVTRTVTDVLVEQYGGQTWYEMITNDGKTGYQNAQKYKPDVDEIIRIYFKEFVKYKWRVYHKEHEEGFSKMFLSRECIPEHVSETYLGIMYLYNIDVICKLFNNVKDDYYLNFSWEKISKQDIESRYRFIISGLEDDIKRLNSQLVIACEEKDIIRDQFRKESRLDEMALQFERDISYMSKKIEGKDAEIISLKRQLDSKDEYIQMLLCQEDPEPEREVDVQALQGKRYLFVGYAREALPELKKAFPNSIFMESEGMNLNNLQVDGIVMLIKFMSHSMYYKVSGTSLAKTVPIVRCNTKNIYSVYAKMMELI